MQVTFDLPDEVVNQLQPFADKLPQILELGLRELNAIAQSGFSGMAEVVEFLASLPTAEAIIALRPSESLQAQINTLVEKKSDGRFNRNRRAAMARVSIFRAYCQNG